MWEILIACKKTANAGEQKAQFDSACTLAQSYIIYVVPV